MTTHIAKLALEWWRAGGDQSRERLLHLVRHFAFTNNETDPEIMEHHWQSALAARYAWEQD